MRKSLAILFLCALMSGNAYAGKNLDLIEGHTVAEAPPGKAMVYFLRPARFGIAINFWLFVDNEPVGVTRGRSYSYVHVEPGKRIIWGKSENISAVEMNIEPGKTYYLKTQVSMGGLKARVKLVPLPESKSKKHLARLRYAQLTDHGWERAKHLAEEFHGRAKEIVEQQ